MILPILKNLLVRDLSKLRQEIASYKNEAAIWRTDKAISNAAGNLCLHLVGNLNTYIGAVLGHSGYIRHRELEFSSTDIPSAELLRQIDATISIVDKTLDQLPEDQLETDFPQLVFKEKTSTAYMLMHLATHLGYHLGQVNYHRRLLDV